MSPAPLKAITWSSSVWESRIEPSPLAPEPEETIETRGRILARPTALTPPERKLRQLLAEQFDAVPAIEDEWTDSDLPEPEKAVSDETTTDPLTLEPGGELKSVSFAPKFAVINTQLVRRLEELLSARGTIDPNFADHELVGLER